DVDEVRPDRLHVVAGGPLQRGVALVGQVREDAALVVGAAVALDEPLALQAGAGVRQAAARLAGVLGEFRHAQAPVGRLGQPDEDLVLRDREPVLGLEVPVHDLGEPDAAVHVRPPVTLLGGIEPAWFAHTTKYRAQVELSTTARYLHGSSTADPAAGIVEESTKLSRAVHRP